LAVKKEFLLAFNGRKILPQLYRILGPVSFATVERWAKRYRDSGERQQALARKRAGRKGPGCIATGGGQAGAGAAAVGEAAAPVAGAVGGVKGRFLTEEQQCRLRAEMARRGIRVKDIAKDLHVSPAAVSHVLSGRKQIIRVIYALKALGIPGDIFEARE